ncbi:hypothetical protein PXH66_08210 [Synoicihabitans lomoniglobus]|uniref:DUF2523 domain-containing protein n=1 Tax=Synoicihabitans lomoniglobus TaxID=2909285 RepID=A0AAF0CRV4_9BACT|nr:hypothetical protein PXH66_03300 [Opitutaceae bacterium LMO-M01]WED66831.1 hypothetical protein PXH66_08210 [Opitutaceae bacterium LMO-M01]
MLNVLYQIVRFFTETTPVLKAVLVLGTIALTISGWVNSLWESLFQRIDALVAPATAGTFDVSPLSLINYLFPLDTVLSMIVTYAGLRLTCSVIRAIKSFIPTIS